MNKIDKAFAQFLANTPASFLFGDVKQMLRHAFACGYTRGQYDKPDRKPKKQCKHNFQPCDEDGYRCTKCGTEVKQVSGGL